MQFNFINNTPKELIFKYIAEHLHSLHLKINKQDNTRPWGGFFVIEEQDTLKFINIYFPELAGLLLKKQTQLSPKILVVAPQKRLSWQYHHRRAEAWKLISGTAAVITSENDEENHKQYINVGDITQLKQGERHRLVGLDDWAIVAEIWLHTNPNNPSDENDIVRIQDDFGRQKSPL